MEDRELFGRLVYLTPHADFFLRERNPGFASTGIQLANRIARVTKVFDWDTAEGELLLKERMKSDKWRTLDPKLYKFVVSIMYPELSRAGQEGILVEEVMPRMHPLSNEPLFRPLPGHLWKEISKEISTERTFNLVPGSVQKPKSGKKPRGKGVRRVS